jgi:hypothetical protein
LFSLSQVGRFRVNVYRQRNSEAAVLRVVKFELPKPEDFHIPESILSLSNRRKGIILTFIIGAILGNFCIQIFSAKAIWISVSLLILAFILMFIDREKDEAFQ